jgi:hypothetical protein
MKEFQGRKLFELQDEELDELQRRIREGPDQIFTQYSILIEQAYQITSTILLTDPTNRAQSQNWCFQTLANTIESTPKLSKSITETFQTIIDLNSVLKHHLLNDLIQVNSREVIQLLQKTPELFRKFFRNSQTRSEGWFNHFHYDGKISYGARAIERFTFNQRNTLWNLLVWTRKQITPVVATNKRGLYMQLNVWKTVQNLLEIDEFWSSSEFLDSLRPPDGNLILSLDYAYWVNELIEESKFNSEFHFQVNQLIIDYLNQQSGSRLINRYAADLEQQEIFRLFQSLQKEFQRQSKVPNHLGYFLLCFVPWTNLEELFTLHSLLCYSKPSYSLITEHENQEKFTQLLDRLREIDQLLDSNDARSDFQNSSLSNETRWLMRGFYQNVNSCESFNVWVKFRLKEIAMISIGIRSKIQLELADHQISELLNSCKIPFERLRDPFDMEDVHQKSGRKRKKNSDSQKRKRRKHNNTSEFHSEDPLLGMGNFVSGWKMKSISSLEPFSADSPDFVFSSPDIPNYLVSYFIAWEFDQLIRDIDK